MKKYSFIYILGATIAFLSIMGIYANGLDVYAEENYLIELDKDNRCKFGLYPTMIEKEVALICHSFSYLKNHNLLSFVIFLK